MRLILTNLNITTRPLLECGGPAEWMEGEQSDAGHLQMERPLLGTIRELI